MAVRNAAAELEKTVASILSQDVDLELIAVENGSTDETPRMLAEIAERDPRVRVLHSDRPGLTMALIAGCAAARAEVIARQDAGDISLHGRLRAQLALLRGDPECVLVSCGVQYVGPRGEELYEATETSGQAVRLSLLHDDARWIRGINHHGTAMFPRRAYEEAGGYRPQFYFAQDLDLWIRLAARGTIAFVPKIAYVASVTPEAISSRYRVGQHLLTRIAVALRDTREQDELLAKAARVQPLEWPFSRRASARGHYFIGRMLQTNGDPRARTYLANAVFRDPLHWRAWAALATSLLMRRRA